MAEPPPSDADTPLHVPETDTTQPGNDSTRRQLVRSEDRTLVPAGTAAAAVVLPPPGYALGTPIGKGGMGEVLAATDLRIGREVAVKRMITTEPDSEQITRFLREARIQARLEHPAIVPVHELGVDELGRPFFTMKRLSGQTLAQKLAAGGASQKAVLRALVDVCLAVEFAHARGVVHRDLKPSNIMLGDYGETYVIDWGIARVIAEDRGEGSAQQGDISTLDDGSTKSGALLGTPGYMSPEQIRGLHATAAADVYALGAILFELLAGESLHKRGQAAVATTLSQPTQSPLDRRADRLVPPELDAVCVQALAEMPENRPRARDLAEKIQAYLDGDRDLERRKALAAEQVKAAQDALASNKSDARASAMRRAGRAIVLDPENVDAANIVSGLLLDPPAADKMPEDLAARLEEEDRKLSTDRSRKFVWAYLALFLVAPLVLVVEVKNWSLLIAFYGLTALGALSAAYFSRTGRPSSAVVLVISLLMSLTFTRVAGPFVLTPVMICCALVAITSMPRINERFPIVMGWTLIAVMLPVVLEWVGALPKTWDIAEDHLRIISDVIHTRGWIDELALVFGNLVFMVTVAVMLVLVNRSRRASQRQLFIQAWHLRQLLPHAKRAWGTRADA
ncbi:MAG: serine/threonine protein kinase [Deltaproteobacteria bacterium]|nr:serine/threonine protein kinase [Deltaproteobacteria bacterium]